MVYHLICVCREITGHEYGLTQERFHGLIPEAAVTHVQHIPIPLPPITIVPSMFASEECVGSGSSSIALFKLVEVALANNLHERVLATRLLCENRLKE